jgi:WD40 repeat protein
MFRWFVGVVLTAALVVGGVLYFGMDDNPPISTQPNTGPAGHPQFGPPLYDAVKLEPLPAAPARSVNYLPIEPCTVIVRDKQDLSSPKDGHLLFVGRDVTDERVVSPDTGAKVELMNVFDGKEVVQRTYLPLKEGSVVDFDQIVAVVDPSLAFNDYASKQAKSVLAKVDHDGSTAILQEAQNRLERLDVLKRKGQLVTDEEWGTALVTVAKYRSEETTKVEAMKVADLDMFQAKLILSQHFLRSKVQGKSVVKKAYKSPGDGIKAQETILQLHGISRLRIEGAAGAQYVAMLHAGLECYLEPSVEMSPSQPLIKAHRGEVNSVAVCSDGEHFVSGSEDRTVCVWKRGLETPVFQLMHPSAVRVVACSPKNGFLLAGCADGHIYLWDLSKDKPAATRLEAHHRGAISALAFSPDGEFFASGGEDYAIHLWKSSGEELYPLDAEHGVEEGHQGTITALTFTPQCTLVSAARDNKLRVWQLYRQGVIAQGLPIENRGGTVSQLGVSADGRFLLFDKGPSIQLIDSANEKDRKTVSVLDNLAGANPFDTLALFSPDGQLMLTGGAGEGRLHLWKTPMDFKTMTRDRGYQVRELVSGKDRSAITCAAFSPATASFAVTGSKEGYVHFWRLPDKEAVENHRVFRDANNLPLRLDLVEHALDGNRTRVAVNIQNPQDTQRQERLLPGQRVTLVVMVPMK